MIASVSGSMRTLFIPCKLNTQFLPPPLFFFKISSSFLCPVSSVSFSVTLSASFHHPGRPIFSAHSPDCLHCSLLPVISIFPSLTATVHLLPLPSLIQHHQYTSCQHMRVALWLFIVHKRRFAFSVYMCERVFLCAHIHEGNKHYCLCLNHKSNVYYSQKHKAITLSDETES